MTTRVHRSWQDWAGLAARLILGIVLLVSGGLKLGNLGESVNAVRGFQILPYDLTTPVGYLLPFGEVALGLLLVTGLLTRWAGLAGALLMVAFIIGIARAWAMGLSIDCGCFGGGGPVERERAIAQYPLDIARDVGLALCGLWLAVRPRTPFSLDAALFHRYTLDDFTTDRGADEAPVDADLQRSATHAQ